MTDKTITTITKSPDEHHDQKPQWISTIPHILENRHLHLINQTPQSAAKLHKTCGFFASSPELSHDIERHLFDAFCENDYDGLLHLSTLHEIDDPTFCIDEEESMMKMNDNHINNEEEEDPCKVVPLPLGKPIGIVFWREVPSDEMSEWLNFNHIVEKMTKPIDDDDNNLNNLDRNNFKLDDFDKGMDQEGNVGRSLKLVRQASVNSFQRSMSVVKDNSKSDDYNNDTKNSDDNAKLSYYDQLTHKWIKIELLAVRKENWGQKIGSLLLACALYHAYLRTKSRAILHVAGGEDNIPAVRLYRHFGFLPVVQGTMFHKPDRDMYVLGNIATTLEGLAWGETLGVKDEEKTNQLK